MRWLVDVTLLGSGSGAESVQVDADTWQNALLAARVRRGEPAGLSGFSIEVLDAGCKAVDPSTRLCYEVRVAGESTGSPPVAEPAAAPAPMAPAAAPSFAPARTSSLPPRPSMAPRPASQDQSTRASKPPPAAVPSQVVFKRELERTPERPLTYREYVYVVPQGTAEPVALALLQSQMDLVRTSLERTPAGKLVRLAAFDVEHRGRASVPPLATLTWKDWSDASPSHDVVDGERPAEPRVQAPAPPQEDTRPAASAPPVESPPPDVTTEAPPSSAASAPPPAAEAPPSSAASAPPPAAEAPPSSAASAPPPAAEAPPPATSTPPPAAAAPLWIPSEGPPVPSSTSSRPPSDAHHPPAISGPSSERPSRRLRGEDLIADLFEAMHELHFLRDAVEGGDYCLSLSTEKIPCRAAIVHLYDIDRREYVVTNARGAAGQKLLLARTPEADSVLATATRRRRAIVLTYDEESDANVVPRYATLGGARRVLVTPVMQAGRFLGAFELVDPVDGQPFTETEANAMTYIAEQFADFVATRGVVTDPERIGAAAS